MYTSLLALLALLLSVLNRTVVADVPDLSWVGQEGQDIVGEQLNAWTTCTDFVYNVCPTINNCVAGVCNLCTGLGQSRINSCCAQATPSACFNKFAKGGNAAVPTSVDAVATATSAAVGTVPTTTPAATTPASGSGDGGSSAQGSAAAAAQSLGERSIWIPELLLGGVSIAVLLGATYIL